MQADWRRGRRDRNASRRFSLQIKDPNVERRSAMPELRLFQSGGRTTAFATSQQAEDYRLKLFRLQVRPESARSVGCTDIGSRRQAPGASGWFGIGLWALGLQTVHKERASRFLLAALRGIGLRGYVDKILAQILPSVNEAQRGLTLLGSKRPSSFVQEPHSASSRSSACRPASSLGHNRQLRAPSPGRSQGSPQ